RGLGMGRLDHKLARVTGAGSGIGKATAMRFAGEGASVVAGVYEPGDDVALQKEAAGSVTPVYADVSREDDCARLTRTAVERYGGVDVLFNNAGIAAYGEVTEAAEEDWARVLDVNLKGVFLCSKHAVP